MQVTGVYPLWLVPTSLLEVPHKGIHVDLGIYGWSPLHNWAGKDNTLRSSFPMIYILSFMPCPCLAVLPANA